MPDVPTLVAQLKAHLLLDKLYTERHKEKGTKCFLKKWKTFILTHYTDLEIQQLMRAFYHTTWYATEQLKGSLGRLQQTEVDSERVVLTDP